MAAAIMSRSMEAANYRTLLTLALDTLRKGGQLPHDLLFELGETPPSLLSLPGVAIGQIPLVLRSATLSKIFFDHGITKPMLERLYSSIANTSGVYKSTTQPGSIVVVTLETKSAPNDTVIVAIRPGVVIGRSAYNVIASVYAKPSALVSTWQQQGLRLK